MVKEDLNWRTFVDRGSIAAKWKPAGTPTFYLIDHRGVIRYRWAGAPGHKVMDAALEKVIEEAEAAGKTPKDALEPWASNRHPKDAVRRHTEEITAAKQEYRVRHGGTMDGTNC